MLVLPIGIYSSLGRLLVFVQNVALTRCNQYSRAFMTDTVDMIYKHLIQLTTSTTTTSTSTILEFTQTALLSTFTTSIPFGPKFSVVQPFCTVCVIW